MNVSDRRLDLLRLEAKGFSKGSIVTVLAKNHQCSERSIWRDFESRGSWQPKLQAIKEEQVLGKTLNRFEYIFQRASLYHHYKKGQSSNAKAEELGDMTVKDKLLALKIMLDAATKLVEVGAPGRLHGELALTQNKPIIVKMWKGDYVKPTAEE